MEAPTPSVQSASSSPASVNPTQPSQPFQTPAESLVKSEIPAPESNESLPPAASSIPDSSPPVSYTITIPSCSSWFSWDQIHKTEKRTLPEFFDERSASKNPSVYKYYRDSIIRRFRSNPSRKITFTEARRGLVGDIGSVRRVFDFLEAWGLINYTPSMRPLPKEKKEAGDTVERKVSSKKLCSNCKSHCSMVCFVTDK
ncbi:SWI/SNF complex subunit SWI3B-like, partial [Phalaenopsis equestris]|uniref:SWI/SNF complex subunit SWI3B-like n=1 Tax=Phalaenopsis equestris TaxID=78828 RepID=UPI0009E5E634